MYLAAISIRILSYYKISGVFVLAGKVIEVWIKDYKSVPNFLCSLMIFVFFLKTDIGSKQIINFLASGTFGAYILHQVPAFRHVLWFDIFKTPEWDSSEYFALIYIMSVIVFFICAVLIDFLRRKTIDKIWMDSNLAKKICSKFDDIMK